MDNQKVPFKKSRMFQVYFVVALIGFLMSCLPEGSWSLFIINEVLALFSLILFYLFWKRHQNHSKRYFSLLSFVMMIAFSVYTAIPLLRMYYGTFIFWFGIVVLILFAILPSIANEKIAMALEFPHKTKWGMALSIMISSIIVFGSIVVSNTRMSSDPQALPLAIFCFLGSIVFLFIAPIMLIRPQRVEDLKRQNR